jgi:hypothetical protein
MRARSAVLAVVFVAAAAVGGCSSDQDPGLTPEDDGGSGTTSKPLSVCSTMPDATIPVGGCLGPDGSVVNPDAGP